MEAQRARWSVVRNGYVRVLVVGTSIDCFWAGNLQVSRFHSIHLAMRESSSLGSIVSSVADASI
jgi:hypothetical protein